MDDVKTARAGRLRTTSFPEALTEISYSTPTRLRQSSSSSEIGARRHSIHVPYTSAFMDAPDRDKKLCDPLDVSYPPRTHPLLDKARSYEVKTKELKFSELSRATQNDLKVSAPMATVKLIKRNSWVEARSFSVENQPSSCDTKSLALPKIKGKSKVFRSHSLPVTTDNAAEAVSFLYRRHREVSNTTQKTLPQIIQPENHGLRPRNTDITSTDGLKSVCVVGVKIPDQQDRAQVLQKHLEKAETLYQNAGLEMKATRLFEWLEGSNGLGWNKIECWSIHRSSLILRFNTKKTYWQ